MRDSTDQPWFNQSFADSNRRMFERLAQSTDFSRVLEPNLRALRQQIVASVDASGLERVVTATLADVQFTALEHLRPSLKRIVESLSTSIFNEQTMANLEALVKAAAERQLATEAITSQLDELQELASDETFTREVGEALEGSLREQPDLERSIDELTTAVSNSSGLPREIARKIVLIVVYLLTTAAIVGVSFVPGLAAVPGALGLTAPGAARTAGRGFDRVAPPDKDADDDPGTLDRPL